MAKSRVNAPLRRGGKLQLDTVDLGPIDFGGPEDSRLLADHVVRGSLQQIELRVGKRRVGHLEGRRHIDAADNVGHIPPVGIALEKRLGSEPGPDLLDIVHHHEAARTHGSCGAHDVKQRELVLVIAVDKHEVVVVVVGHRPVEVGGGVLRAEGHDLPELGWKRGDDGRAAFTAKRIDGVDVSLFRLPQRTRQGLRGAGLPGADLEHAFRPVHDDEVVQERSCLIALEGAFRVLSIGRKNPLEGGGVPPGEQARLRNLELLAGLIEFCKRPHWPAWGRRRRFDDVAVVSWRR